MLAAAQVRQLIVQRLTGLALTGSRVHEGRYHPLADADMPAWLVFIDGDDIEVEEIGYPGMEMHRLRLSAELKLRSVDTLEADMDAGEQQACAALFGTVAPHGLQLTATARRAQREGESAAGTLTLSLLAEFATRQGDPDTLRSF